MIMTFFLIACFALAAQANLLCTRDAQQEFIRHLVSSSGIDSLIMGPNATNTCTWTGISCSDQGLITRIELSNAGLSGSLDSLFFSSSDFTLSFGCSLAFLSLDHNSISCSIPSSITSLYSLQRLDLSKNMISGTIPHGFGSMSALWSLDLAANQVSGTIPQSLCNGSNPLTDLILLSNQLTGALDVSACVNLIYLDISQNKLSGTAKGPPLGSNKIHIIHASDNNINNFTDFVGSGRLTDLVLDRNPFTDASILAVITKLRAINSLSILNNVIGPASAISGTLPPNIFSAETLRSVALDSQFILGTLPDIMGSSHLTSLSMKNNALSGTIPQSFVKALGNPKSTLDLRFLFMCCCGVGELVFFGGGYTNYSGFHISDLPPSNIALYPGLLVANASYAAYNLSLPRLPRGLKFSKTLQPVSQPLTQLLNGTFTGAQVSLGNRSYPNLNCPYLLREEDEDQQYNFLTGWLIDPEYTLFEGCQCDPGLILQRSTYRGGLPIIECIFPPPPSSPNDSWWVKYWWVLLIICFIAFLALLLVIYKASTYGSGPKIFQELFDAQRRATGPPVTGQISIVTTDIEGFSDLMRSSPEATMQAVILHNNLLQKARHSCFGFVIESEGDSFSILFESPADAVKFCIQSQLLLASANWPKGLFIELEESFCHPSQESRGIIHRAMNSFIGRSPPSFSLIRHRPSDELSTNGMKSPKPPHHVQGLRVRMGVATGVIQAPMTPAASHVFELAKMIGDAGTGGQILMCSKTFHHTKDLTEDLGCMTSEGMDLELLRSDKGDWRIWRKKKERLGHEAIILHMGEYLHCPEDSPAPTILEPSDLRESKRFLSLYQVLPPKFLSRGRAFGSQLRLKPEWTQVDGGYFDAPGALVFPLGACDKCKDDVLDPFVATVFLQVDGAKVYAAKNRLDAAAVHFTLLTLIKTTLRLIPGGYLAKSQDIDLRYLMTFHTTEAAIYWCSQLQLASIYAAWPASAILHWPQESAGGVDEDRKILLFRGPRIKMGLSEGHLNRIAADWTGRADVHGGSVNQAARFMDAAAWGGQIAAEEKVALRALEAMAKVSYSFFHKDEVNSADPGHFRNEISLCLPPKSPFRNEILANVAEDACLPPEEETARASLARQGSSGLHFSLKQFSLPRDTSVKREKPSAALWELPDDPDDRLIDHSNPTTLVCQKLGRFKFKGSDEIHDMVNLTPASLLARQYPPDAPTGKGERVSCQPPLCSEILRVDIPSMHFVQEMREQCATDIAKARFARPDVVLRVTSMNDREKSCETPKAAKLNLFSRITTLGRSVPTDINESLEKNEAKQVDLPRKSLFTRLTTLGRSEEMMNERGSSNGLKSIRSHGHGQKSISSNYYT